MIQYTVPKKGTYSVGGFTFQASDGEDLIQAMARAGAEIQAERNHYQKLAQVFKDALHNICHDPSTPPQHAILTQYWYQDWKSTTQATARAILKTWSDWK